MSERASTLRKLRIRIEKRLKRLQRRNGFQKNCAWTKKMVYDDIAENNILIHDKGIDRRAILGQDTEFANSPIPQFNYRTSDILISELKFGEPPRTGAEYFADCIRNSREPLTGIQHARTIFSNLECARPLSSEVDRHDSSI